MSLNGTDPTPEIGLKGGVVEIAGGTPMDRITLQEGQVFDASLMRVNVDHEVIYRNIRANIVAQLPQLSMFGENQHHVCVVGGGWSLKEPDVYEELRALHFNGAIIVALNGSARWLLERNLKPAIHIVLDARPDNLEFIREPIQHCKYFLASQVDPSLVRTVADRDAYLFHAMPENTPEIEICDEYYGKGHWVRIPVCSSVGCTSVLVLRALGFRYQHLFGIDSCYKDNGEHHAYAQPLNDGENPAWFRVGDEGRPFLCSPWQAAQARSFINMIAMNHEGLQISVHGDGLLRYLLTKCASMPFEPSMPL